MTELHTARLHLRPIEFGDVELMMALNSDPEVMRFLTGGRAPSRDEVEATTVRTIGHRWIATRSDTGDFVGWFGVARVSERERELGCRMSKRHWGTGLATEGAARVRDEAFADLAVDRVWAQTMSANRRSRRVLEKCGLRYVKTFFLDWEDPIEGAEHGEVEYEITRATWERSR